MSEVTYARSGVLDEIWLEDELVVMLEDGRVLVVSPLAAAVMSLLSAGPRSLVEVAAHLVEQFGPPPGDIEAAARSALSEMSDSGLVVANPG